MSHDWSSARKLVGADFRRAHFLDHNIWHCHHQPGGIRRHMHYVWIFQWWPTLRIVTSCKLRWHRPVQCWRGKTAFLACQYCLTRLDDHYGRGW